MPPFLMVMICFHVCLILLYHLDFCFANGYNEYHTILFWNIIFIESGIDEWKFAHSGIFLQWQGKKT